MSWKIKPLMKIPITSSSTSGGENVVSRTEGSLKNSIEGMIENEVSAYYACFRPMNESYNLMCQASSFQKEGRLS